MTFNTHGNVTADGVIITPGLRVFTNEMATGKVYADESAARCCGDHTRTQMRVNGSWFSDHVTASALPYPCSGCRHDHWFMVELDNGGVASMNGERLATRFNGRSA